MLKKSPDCRNDQCYISLKLFLPKHNINIQYLKHVDRLFGTDVVFLVKRQVNYGNGVFALKGTSAGKTGTDLRTGARRRLENDDGSYTRHKGKSDEDFAASHTHFHCK